MINSPKAQISIFNDEKNVIGVLVSSHSKECLNSCSRLIRVHVPLDHMELSLIVAGFDYFEKHTAASKSFAGQILLRQVIGSDIKDIVIATPIYLIGNEEIIHSEQSVAKDLKKLITASWKNEFDGAFHTHLSPTTPPQDKKYRFSFVNRFEIFKPTKFKVLFFILLFFSILNYSLINKANTPKALQAQSTQLPPEQMAREQDEILNNAFKEIGIDREKLASDMSCFTE